MTIISPVTAQPTTLPPATVGSAYSVQLSGTGGTGPYSGWSVQSGSLPPGLSLSASGLLSGTPTAGGSFSFTVSLLDSSNIPGATSYTLAVSPSLSTTLVDATTGGSAAGGSSLNVAIGDSVHDTATLSGAAAGPADGASISYAFYADSSCSQNMVDATPGASTFTTAAGSASVIPDSKPVTFQNAGTYYWQASYSGDAGNSATKGACNEIVAVAKNSPALTTTAAGTVVAGSPLTDTATLSGGASPAGTITFTLSDPNNTVVYTDHVTVAGNGAYTTSAGDNPGGFSPTLAGTYQWAASYSGDANNTKVTASSETESAVYGFGGFTSPRPKSTLQKKPGSTIAVKFRLTNTAGQPISPTVAAALAAANDVKATLSGPGITTASAVCTWNIVSRLFQCNIKTPSGLVTGTGYQITAQENVTGTFVTAPAVSTATTLNPESVYVK